MHRALLIEEIAAAIAQEVVDERGPYYPKCRRMLASLARTCRLLSEPALDVLWETAPLWHLAQRMSANIWTFRRVDQNREISKYNEMLVRPYLYNMYNSRN
jgi:hypothetical protein